MTRLSHVAAVNPSTPKFEHLANDAVVTFVPLEAVWPNNLDVTRTRPKAEVAVGYTRFVEGDILVPKISPTFQADRTVTAAGLRGGVGCGTTELHVVRVQGRTDRRYVKYLLSSRPFLHGGSAEMIGVAGQKRVPEDWLRRCPIPVTELKKQGAIANYLDAESARIDALIAKKRQLLHVLGSRQQALRAEVFTALPGLPLKRLLRQRMAYGVLVPRFVDGSEAGARMIRISALTDDGRVAAERVTWIEAEQSREYSRTIVDLDDLILSVVGSMGRSAVVDADVVGANLNRPLARLQPRADVPPRLLWHWTKTAQFLEQAVLATGGDTAQPTLNLSDLADFRVGLQDEASKWRFLLTDLERALAPIERVRDLIVRQISLLKERQQALITAAVTGEVPIFEANRSMPGPKPEVPGIS